MELDWIQLFGIGIILAGLVCMLCGEDDSDDYFDVWQF